MDALLRLYSPFSRMVCRAKSARVQKGSRGRRKSPIPVVSVGNLTLGGSEKTPLAVELLRLALNLGRKPALVTRGYKGAWEDSGGVLSDGRTVLAGWREGGDEPAMVARLVPQAGVFVGKHRYLSCLAAKEAGFDLAVLDDGFQHLKLARDLDIVLHDGAASGPLREGFSALARGDILLWKNGGPAELLDGLRKRFPILRIFGYAVAPRGLRLLDSEGPLALDVLRGKRVLAVAGIARPGRFAASLRSAGAVVASALDFPDHHPYPGRSRQRIAAALETSAAEAAVITEKDAVKLAGLLPAELAGRVYVLEAGLVLPPDFLDHLRRVLTVLGPDGART